MKKIQKNNNKIKSIVLIIISLIFLVLFILNITNIIIFSLPLLFEIFIGIVMIIKYKNTKEIYLDKIIVIKKMVLFITLLLGILNNYIYINGILIKLFLTITIILQVLVFMRINKNIKGV